MKANPPLPTTSARYVANIGARAVAAAQRQVELPHRGKVQIPLRVEPTASGLPQLVIADTGEAVGICASPLLAERLRNFFA